MKKTALTLLACAALGIAYGQEEQKKSGFGLEVNAAYNFALRDLSEGSEEVPAYSVDTYGVDLTAFYAFNKHHTVNIRFGYTTGDDANTVYYDGYMNGDYFVVPANVKAELENIYIMPGYRLTMPLTDSLDLFGGANVGVAQTKGKLEASAYGKTLSESKDKWGFAWSAEVGLAQEVTSTSSVTVALQMQGLYGRPTFDRVLVGRSSSQLYLGVRLGYSCQF